MQLLLSLAAIAALFAFLVWRSRGNPLFLAGGAAFLAMGRSAFIDIVPDQVLLSRMAVSTGDFVFAALALGWWYARMRRRVPCVRLSARWAGLGVFVAYVVALELALSIADGSFHPMVILGTREWFYIPVGYLIALDILRRFTSREVEQYLGVLSLFTACLMVLYVASSMKLGVYPYPKYLVNVVNGTTIIRDFDTFPIWFTLAWAYYLARARKNGWTFVALAVLATGAALSYTRSVIVLIVVTAVLATILPLALRGHRAHALVFGTGVALVAVAILIGGPILAPAQYHYLQERFAGINGPRQALNDSHVSERLNGFTQALKAGESTDPVFGAGLYESSLSSQQYRSYDSDWIRIAYETGWAGLVVFAMPLMLAVFWGTWGYVKRRRPADIDALLLTGVLVTVFSAAWRFSGLVYFWWPALSLFPVALVAYATGLPAVAAAASNPARLRHEPGRLASGTWTSR